MRCRFPLFLHLLVVPGILLAGQTALHAQSGAPTVKVDCAPVLEKMRADIAVDPGRLILAVEDALTTSEVCACPIMRTAIDLAGRDPALTSQIVVAGIRMVPSAAERISGCALIEAPGAATAIRAAVARELGEAAAPWLVPSPGITAEGEAVPNGAPADPQGKMPVGTEVVPPLPDPVPGDPDSEALWPTVGISGIFVVLPVPTRVKEGNPTVIRVVQRIITTRKTLPRRPNSPVTRNIPE